MRFVVPWVLCALIGAQVEASAQGKSWWLWRVQSKDGHWPAAGPDGGRARRDLRATALMMLGLLADGTTLRSGPYRAPLRNAMRWLHKNQDKQGRFAFHSDTDWILDHAMATYAVVEAARLGKQKPYASWLSAIDALTIGLRHQRGRDVAMELLLWAEICARSGASLQAKGKWADSLLALRREIERLRARKDIPDALHERAALLLLETIEDRGDSARRMKIAKPFSKPGWPAKTSDPRAVLYYSIVLYRQSRRDRKCLQAWKRHSRRLTEAVVETQVASGDKRGTWDPVGSFGQDGGRVCTTAIQIVTLTVYYRYCRLSIVAK
jgi:hypothetical protein